VSVEKYLDVQKRGMLRGKLLSVTYRLKKEERSKSGKEGQEEVVERTRERDMGWGNIFSLEWAQN